MVQRTRAWRIAAMAAVVLAAATPLTTPVRAQVAEGAAATGGFLTGAGLPIALASLAALITAGVLVSGGDDDDDLPVSP